MTIETITQKIERELGIELSGIAPKLLVYGCCGSIYGAGIPAFRRLTVTEVEELSSYYASAGSFVRAGELVEQLLYREAALVRKSGDEEARIQFGRHQEQTIGYYTQAIETGEVKVEYRDRAQREIEWVRSGIISDRNYNDSLEVEALRKICK